MKKSIFMSILTVCLVASAQASIFTVDNDVKHTSYFSSSAEFRAYVTSIYAASVRSSSAKVKDHPGWRRGKGRYKQYLRTRLADGDGMVVHTGRGHDSVVGGYDTSDGDIRYPSDFDGSASSLPVIDDSREAASIDNLDPISTPAPGAVLLGMFGLSVIGVKLRKYA